MRFCVFSLMPIQEKVDSRLRFCVFSLMPIQEKVDSRMNFCALSAFPLMPLKEKMDFRMRFRALRVNKASTEFWRVPEAKNSIRLVLLSLCVV